jgi:hypothetical protein
MILFLLGVNTILSLSNDMKDLLRILPDFFASQQNNIFSSPWGGVRLSPLGTSATNWPIVPAPDDDDECGAVGGMRIWRRNRCTQINLPQCHFIHHKSHLNTGRRGGKPATNRLSYGTARSNILLLRVVHLLLIGYYHTGRA